MAPWAIALLLVAPRRVTATEVGDPVGDPVGDEMAVAASSQAPPSGTAAVGSDVAPLPSPPPAPGGRLTRGVFTGRGWVEVGVTMLAARGLPRGRRLLGAGLGGAVGLRLHRNFGVFTQVTTWAGDVERGIGSDVEGNPVAASASVPTTAWDILGVRGFLPVGRRLEPSVGVGSGLVFERRPFTGRQAWGELHVDAGLAVWIASTLSLRLGADYRLHARRDALRHYFGGTASFFVHF